MPVAYAREERSRANNIQSVVKFTATSWRACF